MTPDEMRPMLEEAALRGGEAAVSRLLSSLQGQGLLGAPESRCPNALKQMAGGRLPCYDFREVRRAAACYAWSEMGKRHISWQTAIQAGWNAVRRDCTWSRVGLDPAMAQMEPGPW